MNDDQRNAQMREWQQQNPDLTERIRDADEKRNEITNAILGMILEDMESVELEQFCLMEFLDRSGHRLNMMNALNNVFNQLGAEY